ncbi:MAG: GHMP kinase [Lachnospiraceae bacterium]|nr:GHMP kinase [Lachnospiraceae bacterium]
MIISKTPLRASFFGGGTDFADYFRNSRFGYGSVISTALNMHVYITVNKRFDNKIRVVYTGNELVENAHEVKHNIIREALNITGIENGVEIVYMADLPMTDLGVGLASSSALAVGVLNALHVFKGEYVSPRDLAKEAVDIELNRLGQQIGVQDQYAVAYGGFNRYIFNADDTVSVTPVILSPENRETLLNNLLLFYTGNPRDSRAIFAEQKKTTQNKKEIYDSLVEATDRALEYLKKGDLDEWGYLLNETWLTKKKFASGVSNPLVDDMYEKATKAGALGGKILGAGGGGFMLLYVPVSKQQDVRNALSDFKEIDFAMDMQGSRIIFSD